MCKDKIFIETTGYIKKEEDLSTVENNIIQNTLVLESLQPFPGYHGSNLPEKSPPQSLFLITNKDYSFKEIARITKKIKKEFKHDFNATQGNIYFKTTSYPCIRIKYLKSYVYLPELQEMFQSKGIKFAKHKSVNATGLIVINKYFYVDELEESLYHDMEEDSKYYIELPVDLTWNDFKEMTMHIKNNVDNSNFDAAQGVFYRRSGIIEVVRLYIAEIGIDRIKLIHKMYLDLIYKRH